MDDLLVRTRGYSREMSMISGIDPNEFLIVSGNDAVRGMFLQNYYTQLAKRARDSIQSG